MINATIQTNEIGATIQTATIEATFVGSINIDVDDLALGGSGGAGLVGHGDTTVDVVLSTTPQEYGAAGDGATDDTDAIQAAVDALSAAGGGELLFPAGEYLMTPATNAAGYIGSTAFGTTLKYAVGMKSGVHFVGRGATIKVADDISSRASPQNFAVFYSEEALENVQFHGLTFDLNAANNYFSPDPTNTGLTQEQRYHRYHQAAIFWEGNSGKADDVLVRDCTFRNGGGASTIICGRVGGAGVGRRWRILDCNFLELGLDTYDHSSIFLWCDDALVRGCFWRNALIYAPTSANRAGINAAIETHGSGNIVTECLIENANRMVFVTENSYGRVERVKVFSNIGRNLKYCGVDVAFDGSGAQGNARDIEVYDNSIGLSGDDTNLDGDSAAGTVLPCAVAVLGLDSTVAGIDGLRITGNRATRAFSASGRSSNGLNISLQASAYERALIADNELTGFTRGLNLITDGDSAVGDFAENGNRFLDPLGGHLPAVTKIGVLITAQGGSLRSLYFNPDIRDTRKTQAATFTDAGDLVTATAHGYANGQQVTFDSIASTTGISTNTVYYVVSATADTFKVSATFGGSALALTTNGSGVVRPAGWAFGLVVTETSSTTVGTFHVAKTARFDERIAIANRISGVLDLTLGRALGVPVAGSWPDTGYATLTGATVAAAALPGVLPSDELVVTYDSEVTNAGGFLLQPFYTGTDEVSLALRNVSGGTLFTTPGFEFRITAYPGR